MLKNYLLVALRAFRKQRLFGFINVFGLAVGLACAFLIALYVRHERAYDRHHEHAGRIYRITSEVFLAGENEHFARAASGVGAAMKASDPGVEEVVRLWGADPVIAAGTQQFFGERFYFADASFFRVFTAPFVAGEPSTALAAPNQVVLTESAARRYFGESPALGQTIRLGSEVRRDTPYEVVGVVEDVPETSHLHYDVLASMANRLPEEPTGPDAWVSQINYLAYVLLRPGTGAEAVEARAQGLVEANVGDVLRQFNATYRLHLQPLTDIHLHSAGLTAEVGAPGDVTYVVVFTSVAFIVLLIACINFMNLATARALDRAREVGLRKALGADRGQLVRQFLAETFVLTLIALALAVGLAWAMLPVFNDLTGRTLTPAGTFGALGLLALAAPAVGLLAGAYPAFVLSAYDPTETLRGRFRAGRSGLALRRGLVVTQFALSVVLVTGSLVVQRQLAYARQERVGFDREHVVVLPLRPDEGIRAQEAAFKAAVLGSSAVASASLTDGYPASPVSSDEVFVPSGRPDDEGVHLWIYESDFDLLSTLGMEIAAGRALDPRRGTDSSAYLVNETAARLLDLQRLEGAELDELQEGPEGPRVAHPLVGIVRDFHLESFRHPIRPLIIRVPPADFRYDYLVVRARAGRLDDAFAHLRQTWAAFSSGSPFSPSFLDEEFGALYRSERQLGKAFGYFTVLATLIACLGLLGLSAYATEQRTKEIGVRKVLGASVPRLVALLSRDFLKLVVVAFVVAVPVAYLATHRWLEGFTYRVDLGVWPFVLAGLLAVAVAFLTVSLYTVRAAATDPVKALRYE
jgi:putative ABC transport system permease protein